MPPLRQPKTLFYHGKYFILHAVSHTTEDMIFEWQIPEVHGDPLVLVDGIELPQHQLAGNSTGDCTAVYSTGRF